MSFEVTAPTMDLYRITLKRHAGEVEAVEHFDLMRDLSPLLHAVVRELARLGMGATIEIPPHFLEDLGR